MTAFFCWTWKQISDALLPVLELVLCRVAVGGQVDVLMSRAKTLCSPWLLMLIIERLCILRRLPHGDSKVGAIKESASPSLLC